MPPSGREVAERKRGRREPGGSNNIGVIPIVSAFVRSLPAGEVAFAKQKTEGESNSVTIIGKGLIVRAIRKISSRIPHQSKIKDF